MRPFFYDATTQDLVAELTTPERLVLVQVVGDIIELLGREDEAVVGDINKAFLHPPIAPPSDPALLRLFPSASADEEIAAEFRRLTEDDLRQEKVEGLMLLANLLMGSQADQDEEKLSNFVVTLDQSEQVLKAFNDLRLVMAERLNITDEDSEDTVRSQVYEIWDNPEAFDDEDDGDDADEFAVGLRYVSQIYVLTTFIQESLVETLLEIESN